MTPLRCGVRVNASRSIVRALDDVFADLPDPVAVTMHIRRIGLRRWTCGTGNATFSGDLGTGIHECLIELNRLVGAHAVQQYTAVHAGCVAANGSAVALVGDSGSGKTTLTAAAVQAGWAFLADEVCAIDADTLEVQPYPRPLGLRPASLQLLGIDPPTGPAALFTGLAPTRATRLGTLAVATPLGAVVFVDRVAPDEAATPTPTALTPAEALVQLAHHSLRHPGSEVAVFRRLESIVRRVPAFTLRYHHAPDAAAMLGSLLDAR